MAELLNQIICGDWIEVDIGVTATEQKQGQKAMFK
jgi:hypothetical protein